MKTVNQIPRSKISTRSVIFLISLVSLLYLSPKFANVFGQTLPGQFYYSQESHDEKINDRASATVYALCYGGELGVQDVVAWSWSFRTCGLRGSPVRNTADVEVQAGEYYIFQYNSATVLSNARFLSLKSASTNCDAVQFNGLNIFNPEACSAIIELPNGIAGGCNGAPDWNQYPTTGCAIGFVNFGEICERSVAFQHRCAYPAGYEPETCTCPDGTGLSPIIIDVDGSGFALTDAANGVDFDLLALGYPQHISWTAANSTNAFLVLDRNGNGTIDSGEELFGNVTEQPLSRTPNGFSALAEFDKIEKGGNNDGLITRQDAIFDSLRLWQDTNHNGISEAGELHTIESLGLRKIDLDYRESRRTDEFGNQFKYRAKVKDSRDAQLGRWAWDVFLLRQP